MTTSTSEQQVTYNRFKAMQHPLRAKCLRRLVESGPLSPAELAREFEIDVHHVSYHMKRLVLYGCAELVEERPVGGTIEHFYVSTERHLLDIDQWAKLVEASPELAETLVDEFMQMINEDFIASRRAAIVGMDEFFHITRTPRQLDHRGLVEMLELAERMRLLGDEIEQRALKRANDDEEPLVPVSESILVFKVRAPRGGAPQPQGEGEGSPPASKRGR